MSNTKAYVKALNNHVQFDFYDSLTRDEQKKLRSELKQAKNKYNAFTVDGLTDRAVIIPTDSGFMLRSYNTIVCKYYNGVFFKSWDGYSHTTMKHINAFRKYLNLAPLSKKEWIMYNEK